MRTRRTAHAQPVRRTRPCTRYECPRRSASTDSSTSPSGSRREAISDLIQQEPQVGEPISERTEIRVLLDDEAMYIGATCFDSNRDGIIGREMRRDNALANDDRFEIVLDTFHDHRNAYHFVDQSARDAVRRAHHRRRAGHQPRVGRAVVVERLHQRHGVVGRDPDPVHDAAVARRTRTRSASTSSGSSGARTKPRSGPGGTATSIFFRCRRPAT